MDVRYDHLSEQAIVELQRLDYNHQLAAKGLNGTLFGACASVLAILVLIFAPAVTGVQIVDGWQLVAIVALLGAAVVFYGAFIFNRALSIDLERTKDGISLAGSTHDLTTPPTIDEPARAAAGGGGPDPYGGGRPASSRASGA